MVKNTRIAYIDQLKGFLMMLVIIGHFSSFGKNCNQDNFHDVIYMFHMPFFFFLSGIVVHELSLDKLKTRVKKLLFPFFVVGSCFSYWSNGDFFSYLVLENKIYFWYLLVLVYCLIIIACAQLCNRLRKGNMLSEVILVNGLYALVIAVTIMIPKEMTDFMIVRSFCVRFPFFYFGYLCNRLPRIKVLFEDNEITYAVAIILIIPIYLLSRNSLFHYLYMVGAICVIMVLMHYFKKGLIIPHSGKLMSCFGLHTLDIYLFHGFILTYIDFAFLDHRYISHNFLIQFLVLFGIACLVAYVSMIIGRLCHNSSILSNIIYGYYKT